MTEELKLDFDETLSVPDILFLRTLVDGVAEESMVVVEVGTWKGLSARTLAAFVKPMGGRLYCVDHYEAYDIANPAKFKGDVFQKFHDNMEKLSLWENCICPMVMDSMEAARIFADGTASLIFIDADHHEREVAEDIKAWLPKVKAGGILCGHDWNVHLGVNAAVMRLLPGYQVPPDIWPSGHGSRIWYYRKG